MKKNQIINKIAFMVHEPTMWVHYSDVWAKMPRDALVIVLLGGAASAIDNQAAVLRSKLDSHRYEYTFLSDFLGRQAKYSYVVSNHMMGGVSKYPINKSFRSKIYLKYWSKKKTKIFLNYVNKLVGLKRRYNISADPQQYLPLQLGIKQIRFMYGADISDGWSLDAWNAIYDLFLCHGPNDERYLKERFKGLTAIMGYPRYDGYFDPDLDTEAVRAEFGIDPGKQTLLWMPTVDLFNDDTCSIPFFAEALSSLADEFNLIIRPHPISFRRDPAGIALLESLNYRIDRDATRDMNPLLKLAEAVLCDHGGSAFGALYLGKKLVFLKTPTKDAATVLKGSSNKEIMQYFPAIEADEVGRLPGLLRDESYWQAKLAQARVLSDRYFADFRGTSARRAASILANLDSMFAATHREVA